MGNWNGNGKCIQACWKFTSSKACDKSRCVWDGKQCKVDPCSAPGENCNKTKCCSADRGAQGSTCFEKDATWSSCLETCDGNATEGPQADWSCKKLGNRTPFSTGCSWSGEDCSKTHCCNNVGFSCAVKDPTWTGCVQTVQKTTWVTKQIPLPSGWQGTVLGYGRSEFAVQPASDDSKIAGTSL